MKNKWLYVILVLASFIFLYSFYHIISWVIDNKNTENQIKIVQDIARDYVDNMNEDSVGIDFKSLQDKNHEVKGWITVLNTNINYPFVQHENNYHYLTHSFDKSYNKAGWIFLDYRNDINNLSTNTIIYGHGRVDGTMFGSLKKVLSKDWLDNPNNYIITLYTDTKKYQFEIFSAYHVMTTDDYLNSDFNSVDEVNEFLKLVKSRSTFSFPTEVTATDKILTLSTCYSDIEKMVVHAKLIKQEDFGKN